MPNFEKEQTVMAANITGFTVFKNTSQHPCTMHAVYIYILPPMA
jgi:hypothetical protein